MTVDDCDGDQNGDDRKIVEFRPRPNPPNPLLAEFVLTCYPDAFVLGDKGRPWQKEELMKCFSQLHEAARWVNDLANAVRGDDQDQVMIEVVVYESGKIFSWASNRIETHDQIEWAKRQVSLADFDSIIRKLE